ncbi:MAG: hypothetical protein IJE46_01225 [Clostridia bacterium]|nr:hypothetical protein [Clostridia bacterium]
MKKYQKPVLEVVELAVAENIAALVPKTIYKRSAGSALAQKGLETYKLQGESLS